VAYIAERIAPAVWERYPQARFVIIGQGIETVADYRREGLLFTGFVDARAGVRPNLSDYLSASNVVLVPLDSGSGTRLKIVEAAANARPVVSTRIGAEGQSFVDGQEILLSDEVDQDFVDATLRLLDDPALGNRLGRAARSRVLAEYSWRSQVSKMERIYAKLAPAGAVAGTSPVEDLGN
jgi:glycosyltransferase involved in cell wall biosynthesis